MSMKQALTSLLGFVCASLLLGKWKYQGDTGLSASTVEEKLSPTSPWLPREDARGQHRLA